MGSICTSQGGVISIMDQTKSRSHLSHKLEMASPVYTENRDSFYNSYKLHANPIAYGEYGEIWLCNRVSSNKQRIVKIINKSALPSLVIEEQMIPKLVEKLKMARCKNIAKLYKVYEDRTGYFVVQEKVLAGDLDDLIEANGRISEKDASKIIYQLLLAVSQLHKFNIKFCDIKPGSLYFSDFSRLALKFSSFSIAGLVYDENGGKLFIAPEKRINKKSDSWSIGVLLTYMLVGGIEENGKTFTFDRLEQSVWGEASEKAKSLAYSFLENDPKSRISIADALQHAWIQSSTSSEDLEIDVV